MNVVDGTDTTDTGAPPAGAPAASTAEADAAAKAVADKATADAAAAEAAKTPEQKAADQKAGTDKAAADKATADAAAAEAAKNTVPAKYELKLPEKPAINEAVVERTAAIARTLGLSQDNAQKTLEFVNQEVAAQLAATLTDWSPPSAEQPDGGVQWKAQDARWRADALADEVLGGGKPEQLQASIDVAKRVVSKFGDEKVIAFLQSNGLGSHPSALRLLVNIGKAMSEGSLVIPSVPPGPARTEEAAAGRIYDHPTSKAAQ